MYVGMWMWIWSEERIAGAMGYSRGGGGRVFGYQYQGVGGTKRKTGWGPGRGGRPVAQGESEPRTRTESVTDHREPPRAGRRRARVAGGHRSCTGNKEQPRTRRTENGGPRTEDRERGGPRTTEIED
jgi:hypothetical protein